MNVTPGLAAPGTESLIQSFGLLGILLIVFAESGLLVGFFLPGDSLLFTSGLLTAADRYLHQPMWLLILLIVVSAVLGDQVGYLFGRRVGPALFRRPDSRFFRQENAVRAHVFFEKHGAKALILARFVPVARTFTPIAAGVGRMEYRAFTAFNIVGGTLWGAGVTALGYSLGHVDVVREHIEIMLAGIVLLSSIPVALPYLRARGKARRKTAGAGQRPGAW